VTGAVPFDRAGEFERVEAHLNDPIPSARAANPEIPEQLDAVIARALAKDPAGRFASAGELATALDRALAHVQDPVAPTEHQATTTTGPAPTSRIRSPAPVTAARRRPRWPWAAAAIAGLVVAGAVVAILSAGSGSGGLTAHAPLALGGAVGAMAGDGNGTVWVSVPSKGELQELTRGGRKIFPIGGQPGALVAVPDGVWVAGGGTLTQFGPGGKPIAGTGQRSNATLLAASLKHGTVFTADSTGAIRRLGSTATARVPPAPNAIAFGEGWLWVALGDGKLERLSPGLAGGREFPRGPTGPGAIAFDQGVWTAQANGDVSRFDPRSSSLAVNATIHVAPGSALTGVAAIDGDKPTPFVWAISFATARLYQLSYDRLRVIASLHLPSPPVALAAATPTSVWVATENNELIEVTSAAG
jgi:hypothetical protein